jgi:CheY-like chemotaxis protein
MTEQSNGVSALVVDDDADNLELISYVLEQAGYRVTTARSAAAALEAIGNASFGILLNDIGLPDQDGITLLREMRARGCTVPAIALTGYSGDGNRQRLRDAGYQRHIAKPVDLSALLAVAKELTVRPSSA